MFGSNNTPRDAQKRADRAAARQSARDRDWSNRSAGDDERVKAAGQRRADIGLANRRGK